MALYFITGNVHKFSEAKKVLQDIEQVNFDLDEIQSMDSKEIIAHKLKQAMLKHNGPLFCEDVSLCISSFNGFPGPLVKWWNNSIPEEDRVRSVHLSSDHRAKIICTIGYFNGTEMHFFEGIIDGTIVMPRGKSDFGFDPIFEPKGTSKTFAEMTIEEKNAVSHRFLALKELKKFLESRNK